jgi:hypothetical protein
MKIEIIYHEIKRKEFRKEKTLQKFLKTKLPSEILRAIEIKNGVYYLLEIQEFLRTHRRGIDDKVTKIRR